jgi:hypothetical protein
MINKTGNRGASRKRTDDIRKSITALERLVFFDIRDIRDELNALKSIARYQETVQDSLHGNVPTGRSKARQILDDLEAMERRVGVMQTAVRLH